MSKIVVGVDGSEESARALVFAVEEAGLRSLPLEVVYSFEGKPEWLRFAPGESLEGLAMESLERSASQGGGSSPEESAREHADALVRSMVAQHVRAGIEVRRTVNDVPKPGPHLVERSQGASLLVVGTRGRGSVGSMLLGSVSTYCVHHADCPVVVVK